MYRTRFPFLALMLVLLISACSRTPENLPTPSLEPQFGTAGDDYGIDVDFASSNRIYSLSQQTQTVSNGDFGDTASESKVLLDRRDSNGNLVWSVTVDSSWMERDGGDTIVALSLVADAQGNVRVLTGHGDWDGDQGHDYYYIIDTFNASGRRLSEIRIDENVVAYISFAVDGSGNTYLTSTHEYCVEYNDDYFYTCKRYRYEDEVNKYSSSGTHLWQRLSTIGTLKGITVSSTGNVFVVGWSGIARYSSSGTLNWTKSGGGDAITVSGSSVYVRSGKTIRKHDSTGKQLWSKAQGGLSGMVIADMTADGNGNVYLTGKYAKTSSDQNAFYRKVNAKGSVVWTKTFGTSKYDDARRIATLNGSEIYVTGSTEGTLSHPNRGGSDGYLRKMDGSGNRVWTR